LRAAMQPDAMRAGPRAAVRVCSTARLARVDAAA